MARPLLLKLLNLAGLTDTKYERHYARVRANATNTIVIGQLVSKRSSHFFPSLCFLYFFLYCAALRERRSHVYLTATRSDDNALRNILARVFLRQRSFGIARDVPNAACIVRDRTIARVTRLRTTVSTGFRR